jgi:miniconductance mechanosensitive channel
VSEAFQNWKGLDETGVRSIKRSIFIDVRSIKFPDPELMARFQKKGSVSRFPEDELSAKDKKRSGDKSTSDPFSDATRYTNLGLFRMYAEDYLRKHPLINNKQTILIKHLEPSGYGIPLQVMAFCADKAMVTGEHIQAEIMEHLYATLKEFGLKGFQPLTDNDLLPASGTI